MLKCSEIMYNSLSIANGHEILISSVSVMLCTINGQVNEWMASNSVHNCYTLLKVMFDVCYLIMLSNLHVLYDISS